MLNNLLRAGLDVLELYYGHYFVRGLFRTIYHFYQADPQGQKQFVCYRGAFLSEEERQMFISKVGEHIKTLGFLSASMDKKIAQGFCLNAFI